MDQQNVRSVSYKKHEERIKRLESLLKNARNLTHSLEKKNQSMARLVENQKQEITNQGEKVNLYRGMKIKSLRFFKSLLDTSKTLNADCGYLELGDSFMPLLVSSLLKFSSIDTLDLEGNLITDEGVAKICELILSGPPIVKINLSFNQISIEGAWQIVQAVLIRDANAKGDAYRIRKIDLSYNQIQSNEIYACAWEELKVLKEKVIGPAPITKKDLTSIPQGATLSQALRSISESLFDLREVRLLALAIDRIFIKQYNPEELTTIYESNKQTSIMFEKSPNSPVFKKPVSKTIIEHDDNSIDIHGLFENKPAFPLTQIELALRNGLNINGIDRKLDESLLMYASRNDMMKMVQILVNKLANLNLKNVIFK